VRIAVEHRTRLTYNADVVESVMDTRARAAHRRAPTVDHIDLRVSRCRDPPVHRRVRQRRAPDHLARPHRAIRCRDAREIETTLPIRSGARSRPTDLSPRNTVATSVRRRSAGGRELSTIPNHSREPRLEAAQKSHLVPRAVAYRPDVTDVETTVSDVADRRVGRLQDFAHVLIGLCRAIRIPEPVREWIHPAGAEPDEPKRGAGASMLGEAFTPRTAGRGSTRRTTWKGVASSEDGDRARLPQTPATRGVPRGRVEGLPSQ